MFTDIKLLILDRDGVINHDSEHYIKSPEEFIPIEGSLEAIAALNKAGYLVTVATNQSGVGRGYYSIETLEDIHVKLNSLLTQVGGRIDLLVYCPHTPEDHCSCRKPKPGLIQTILHRFPEIRPSEVLMVGDSLRDLEAAWEEGCHTVLVRTGKGEETLKKHLERLKDVMVFEDLREVVGEMVK